MSHNLLKNPKPSNPKKFLQDFRQIPSSDPEQVKIPSDKTRVSDEVHSKRLLKTSSKFNGKVKSLPSELMTTLKSGRAKILDSVKTRLKSPDPRPASTSRPSKDRQKEIKPKRSNSLGRPFGRTEKLEKNFFQLPVTCRDNPYEDLCLNYEDLRPCRADKVNKKTISLIETEVFGDFREFSKTSNDLMKKTKTNFNLKQDLNNLHNLQNSQNSLFAGKDSKSLKINSGKTLQSLRRDRAARVIQRNFRVFLQKQPKTRAKQLRGIVKEQISWKAAQILTLEYLKQKELEDLQFLARALGRNNRLEEILAKAVQDRYDNFSQLFKANFEDTERKYKETVQSDEISELSCKIKDTKEVVSKIIQETNISSSLSKLQIEGLVKARQEMTIKINDCAQEPKSESRPRQVLKSNANDLELNDIEQLDPTMLSPILPEIMNFPDLSSLLIEEQKYDNNATVPEPCEKFEDFSLEALMTETPGLKLEETKDLTETIPRARPRMTNSEFVYLYLKEVFLAYQEEIIAKLETPVLREGLDELAKIRNDFNGFDDRFSYEAVVDIEKVLKGEGKYGAGDAGADRQLLQADLIQKTMLLAASDEVLQYLRPYNIKGAPQVWSSQARILGKRPLQAEELMNVFLAFMKGLALCQVGKMPTEATASSNEPLDAAALAAARNEALELALSQDIQDSEWVWNDFEFEETQAKLIVADLLLSTLAEELADLI